MEQRLAKLEEQKLKLLELVKLHKKRIEDERNERHKCEQLIRVERQKLVRLESTVAKSELDCAATVKKFKNELKKITFDEFSEQVTLQHAIEQEFGK